ncbi:MAG TPA: allophanate hydrolase, partial [Burkholderiales bacterium]|nr:allophanate hydrolase [Burkholderiales bacterium]
LPLYGIPFAIKDNIDLAGHPTTAACREYSYVAQQTAAAVQTLLDAGAMVIGKTNLDQFATGLVGTRSPYGACANTFDARYISGGSSSGSAVAVAASLVSFSLGTDTAGSGRIPAGFNNLIGLKPTRGLVSTRGVVPACRSLDCVSIFALTAEDAHAVFDVMARFDAQDPYSREERRVGGAFSFEGCRVGVPRTAQLEFFGNREYEKLFHAALEKLERLGAKRVTIDFAPFLAAAKLLYEGPWVAERYVAIREFLEKNAQALHPVTREIISGGAKPRAAEAFAAQYRLQALLREAEPVWQAVDVLVAPTAGTIYTLAQLEADPIRLNSNLGVYTNFVNLMDLSAIAVPAGFTPDKLPFGITLLAPAFQDRALCALAQQAQRALVATMGARHQPLPPAAPSVARPNGKIKLAVCGAHMSGLPLNPQLTERGARLLRSTRTTPNYRLYALEGFSPPRPGMIRAAEGAAIEVEVWELAPEGFGTFVDGIPAPLGIGTVELEGGDEVKGFLCEAYATRGAQDVSHLGGWRAYLKTKGERR